MTFYESIIFNTLKNRKRSTSLYFHAFSFEFFLTLWLKWAVFVARYSILDARYLLKNEQPVTSNQQLILKQSQLSLTTLKGRGFKN